MPVSLCDEQFTSFWGLAVSHNDNGPVEPKPPDSTNASLGGGGGGGGRKGGGERRGAVIVAAGCWRGERGGEKREGRKGEREVSIASFMTTGEMTHPGETVEHIGHD